MVAHIGCSGEETAARSLDGGRGASPRVKDVSGAEQEVAGLGQRRCPGLSCRETPVPVGPAGPCCKDFGQWAQHQRSVPHRGRRRTKAGDPLTSDGTLSRPIGESY
ncbi:hypothetical protein NDU88_002247 [Pleurodeles waltl]|uniref:Uncharacterized protein n=1 Tax=Pleurodeles waltl TaxID=8319 RepID=A0AAV7U8V7_PLEWA|nr:hypothetical protein NDU88_002247 [Pleurodeles waltl]